MKPYGRRPIARCDRGATLILMALLMTALFLIIAIVVDLGATRADRRGGQLAVDNAATSAASTFSLSNPEAACQAAVDYLEITLEVQFTGHDCTQFNTCPGGSVVTATAPGYSVRLHRPVANDSPLMARSSTIGATSGEFATDVPGEPCNRFGVELTTTGDSYFGGVAGESERRSSVHAVALVTPPPDGDRLINLAVLERSECDAIKLDGNGGAIAGPVVDPVDGVLPGNIAVDSNGLGVGCGTTVTLGGTPTVVRADGPAGCAGELPTGAGHGCGRIDLFATGAPGCNAPACDAQSGTIAPSPDRVLERVTRAPVDHKYNCKSSYSGEVWWSSQPGISGCGVAGRPAYIDALTTSIPSTGSPSGWQVYPGPAAPGSTCEHRGGPQNSTITVPPGNWYVDCDTLIVDRRLIFQGGNVVFKGNVSVGSQGLLSMNGPTNTSTMPWTENAPFAVNSSSAEAAYFYFRNGTLTKGGQASIAFLNMMGYFSSTSTVSLGGGDGSLNWTAPSNGPFKDLALWSDSALDGEFGGQANLVMDGAFFMPLSRMIYTGQGDNNVTAQFIARKLLAKGQGSVYLTPTRGVKVPPRPIVIGLIR